ncbi:phosphate signaling complex protein PhoU [Clostridium sulfidigenes]|uniref:phosphate signaling complex protein PhoU n=1 Tax=Clostridium sulfidigenes TaxID=318464 RepID=UPI000E881806|nr:phosphate transport system regulatory protein PhoU [Clostridium sp.]
MTRNSFDLKLQQLHEDLMAMGEAVAKQIEDSIDALKKQDEILAEKVIQKDDVIDDFEEDIEDKCIKLMATEQPLASDLRRIFITTKIITDLERMGDHAVDIAKIAKKLIGETYIKELIDIPNMAKIVEKMIKDSLEVYITTDISRAHEVSKMDDQVDRLFKSIFDELLVIMRNDQTTINQASQFLFICKFLERMADHATNICEWTIYLESGEKLKLN